MDVLSVVGARPQFIKAFVVSRELRATHDEVLVHTGQHYDEELSDIFFEELGIPEPDYDLGIGSESHATQTARMMIGLEEVVEEYAPDILLCYGDTNSTLAAAIVASKFDLELAHVEAGLRSFNRGMPEEINRILTDHASDILFAPSERAVDHLQSEGITEKVYNVGDVMYDSLLWAREEAKNRSTIREDLGVANEEYLLATVHRPRNTDDRERLKTIITSLAIDQRRVVFPAHPRTIDRLKRYDLLAMTEEELTLIDPVSYLDFVSLQAGAEVIVTDSGGIQKEAFFLDVPCITLREETEWPETIEAGGNLLVGADAGAIREALANPPQLSSNSEPYGDGTASKKIVEVLNKSSE
ncbi:non-hydrolyzing UDP-N-acetylglucosamine 2-epimerase [Haloplanus aerogenes]|uniref:UDP-N-acetylglucosamine 2-epimerase (Non-hydrolysing) n=1 Tax=Haloplanus aerogenes TaxID=660522 RepID=A0A3G8QTJ1_9EURY|nr:UDP-N-acetylglucosamine 2-epimerase (non-hydrolyzing) [Haloplanus aerogenes]AZH24759.1 UDP-N-acetylglucosamine 2-epimerase (non-hydrolyzing) [Haloplanus aerogenes]RMB23577.1 UDP-N-acetylglucosamine 2-epimerase (non-hydrolysing) [Haloplanus aerogenes]